jgi:dipeptidase
VRIPVYAGVRKIPKPYQWGVADATVFSFESAFWVTNMVANLVYTSFEYIDPEVQTAIADKYATFFAGLEQTDALAVQQWKWGQPGAALETATQFTVATGEKLVADWLLLWQRLFMKYFDLAIHTPVPGSWQPNVITQQVPQATYRRIVKETGQHYLLPSSGSGGKRLSKKVGI